MVCSIQPYGYRAKNLSPPANCNPGKGITDKVNFSVPLSQPPGMLMIVSFDPFTAPEPEIVVNGAGGLTGSSVVREIEYPSIKALTVIYAFCGNEGALSLKIPMPSLLSLTFMLKTFSLSSSNPADIANETATSPSLPVVLNMVTGRMNSSFTERHLGRVGLIIKGSTILISSWALPKSLPEAATTIILKFPANSGILNSTFALPCSFVTILLFHSTTGFTLLALIGIKCFFGSKASSPEGTESAPIFFLPNSGIKSE